MREMIRMRRDERHTRPPKRPARGNWTHIGHAVENVLTNLRRPSVPLNLDKIIGKERPKPLVRK